MKKRVLLTVFLLICVLFALYFVFFKQNFILYDEKRMEGHLLKIVCQDQKLIFLDNDKQTVLMEGFNPSIHNFDKPEIAEFHGGVLISFTWQTNKIGSLLELWTYDIESGRLDQPFTTVRRTSSLYHLEGDTLSLEELNFSAKIAIEDTKYQIPLEGELEITAPLFFKLSPEGELITQSLLLPGANDWIKNNGLLSYYTWEDGKLKFLRYELPLDDSDSL